MADWKTRRWWSRSARYIARYGRPGRISFCRVLKLKEKWRQGSHWRKRYELPKTAYHRLCAPGMLALQERRRLRDRYESLDPFTLKDELETKLKQILKPKSAP